MIETVILDYLNKHLSVKAYIERPSNSPDRFVLFEKSGSSNENFIFSATFIFQSYAKSMYEATFLNEKLKTIINQMIELDEFSKIKLNSDYNFTDTETKEYRYQAVFDIKHY